MKEVHSKDPRQYVRAGLVIAILLLSGTLSSVVSVQAHLINRDKQTERMLVEMLLTGRNSVSIGKNETLGIAYAIPTDSILGVTRDGTNRIFCRGKDGISSFRVRLYRNRAPAPPTPIGAIVGDTMVIGCGAWGGDVPGAIQPELKWAPITCSPATNPVPACHDTANSIPLWRSKPCAWLQNSATTIACYPLGTPRLDTVSVSNARRRPTQGLQVEKERDPTKPDPNFPLGVDNQSNPPTLVPFVCADKKPDGTCAKVVIPTAKTPKPPR